MDFRWEREWRHVGDFRFEYVEVAFGLYAAREVNDMESLVGSVFAFIDPDWEPEQIREHFQQRGHPELAEAF